MPRGKKNVTRGGRGRGRGRGAVKEGPSTIIAEGSTSKTFEEKSVSRQNRERAKQLEKAEQLEKAKQLKRAKQLERALLPDAPPRKRAKKDSPERTPCRLVPGTPSVPPPSKQQPWQFQKPSATSATVTTSSASLAEVTSEGTRSPIRTSTVAEPSMSIITAPLQPLRKQPSTTVQDISTEKDQATVTDWLNDLSDCDDMVEDFPLPLGERDGELNFANEAPAHLPDELDSDELAWLMRQDCDSDQLMRGIIPDGQLTFDWSNDADSFLGRREEFRSQCGPTFPLDDGVTPMEVFFKFFDNELFDILVTETNRHATRIDQPLQQHSRFNRISDTNRDEMAVFTAMLILQGLAPIPVEKDFWRENGWLTLKYFKTLMSYNRFILLKRLLHFSDNDAATETMTTDELKLRKLGPLLDLLNRKFSELYLPSRDIAIDESLLKWHGRLSFAQKIATKAAKVGVKSYELCESTTGYLWKFFIYTGKGQTHGLDTIEHDSQAVTSEQVSASTNITTQIVVDLAKPLFNRGHTLTMDNFYNSPLLARYLKANGTDCLGTLRVNRDFVPDSIKSMSKSELRQGEIVQSYCRDMSILLWRDKNDIAMISTFHKGEIGGKEKRGHYRYKPQAVLDYNLSMGGVDRKDQLLAAHPIERVRNQAWYKKIYRRLLNVTILNAFIIFKTRYPDINQRQFRIRLANEMIKTFRFPIIERPIASVPETSEVQVLRVVQGKHQRPTLIGNHFVGLSVSKYLTCVFCRKSRTKYICKQCTVSLCLDICFERYHTGG